MILEAILVLPVLLGLGASAAPTEVNWCVPYDQPPAFAGLCSKALAAANTDDVEFKCVIGGSVKECIAMIVKGEAHLSTFDGADAYEANSELGLVPLVFENYGQGAGASYYAVAAVTKDFCEEEDEPTLESLEGKRSCHTGYRKTAGWMMPFGTLLSKGLMEDVDEDPLIEDDAEAIAGFFSKVCAPRTSSNGPKNTRDGEGELWEEGLCSGCTGDCSTHDKYYDYQGAFRCLMEDAGDVAFVKHSTIPDFAKGGPKEEDWSAVEKDEFMLLCPDGGCAPVDDYEACNLAKVPAHSVVAAAELGIGGEKEELGTAIQDALVKAAEDDAFLEAAVEVAEQENFIFKDGTTGLDAITDTFEEAFASVIPIYSAVDKHNEAHDGDK